MLWPEPILSARRSEPPISTEMMRPAMRPNVRTVFVMEVKFSFFELKVRVSEIRARTHLINVKCTERNTSSGAEAHFFLSLDVGAKAPTSNTSFMKWLLVMPELRAVFLGLWRFPELNAVAVRVGDPSK